MKTALITGAGQRLGKAIAERLVETGEYGITLHYFQSKKSAEALG